MTDPKDQTDETPAGDAGVDAVQTDEQLWQELEAEEADKQEDDEPSEQADMADPSDDPSDGNGSGEGDVDAAKGMDPEALQAQIDRLQHSLKSEKGRTAASRREIEELNRRIADAEKTQRSNVDDAHLKERREKIKASTEEYGDVIGPLVEHITDLESRFDSLSARDKAQIDTMKGQLAEKMDAELGVFQTEHPDGFDTIIANRDTFDAWIEDQPKALRDIYAANEQSIVDGGSAALLVGMFKQALLDGNGNPAPAQTEQQRLSTRRDRQLAGAASTRTTTQARTTSAPPKDGADPATHWDYFERLDKRKGA